MVNNLTSYEQQAQELIDALTVSLANIKKRIEQKTITIGEQEAYQLSRAFDKVYAVEEGLADNMGV